MKSFTSLCLVLLSCCWECTSLFWERETLRYRFSLLLLRVQYCLPAINIVVVSGTAHHGLRPCCTRNHADTEWKGQFLPQTASSQSKWAEEAVSLLLWTWIFLTSASYDTSRNHDSCFIFTTFPSLEARVYFVVNVNIAWLFTGTKLNNDVYFVFSGDLWCSCQIVLNIIDVSAQLLHSGWEQ